MPESPQGKGEEESRLPAGCGVGRDGKGGQAPVTWGGGCRVQASQGSSEQCTHSSAQDSSADALCSSGRERPARVMAYVLGRFRPLLFLLLNFLESRKSQGEQEATSFRLRVCFWHPLFHPAWALTLSLIEGAHYLHGTPEHFWIESHMFFFPLNSSLPAVILGALVLVLSPGGQRE